MQLHMLPKSTEWQSTRRQIISLELVRVSVMARTKVRVRIRVRAGVKLVLQTS